jgi:hypothetical protein
MFDRMWITFSLGCAALAPAALAQQNQTTEIPPESGIYYQTASGWAALRSTLMMPFLTETAASFLSVGRRQAVVELPGSNSGFRIANARPTFAVRGLSPASGMYLVRSNRKQDYREIRMPIDGRVTQWARFRAKDLSEIEMEPLFADVMRVRPHADLKPGEYVLVSDLEPRYRAIRLGFAFAVTGP